MTLPKLLARFNRRLTNRITSPFAGWLPGFGVLTHRGRRSGREYLTPVNVLRRPGGYRIALVYGADADWVRNVIAAGGCGIRIRGQVVALGEPRVGADRAVSWAPWPVRPVLRTIGACEFLDCSVNPDPSVRGAAEIDPDR